MPPSVAATSTSVHSARRPPKITLPTSSQPSRNQTVIGCHSPQNGEVEEFRGLPYATVSNRWEHSILRDRLPQDVFDATKHGPRCPQPSAPNTTADFQSHLDFPDVDEHEFECLNLQVARPSRSSLEQAGLVALHGALPVYVYIHGGALAFGAATDPIWDPARLIAHALRIKKPFISVNINYRLNAFGFLACDTLSAAKEGCNFGLMDQARAIEWISANIQAFGGDPNAITLGGQSAGGTTVYTHALRALHDNENRLFRACIMQSPAAGICGPFSMEHANRQFDGLCEHLRLSCLSSGVKIQKLRALSTTELLDAVDMLGWHVFALIHDEKTLSSVTCGDLAVQEGQEQIFSDTGRCRRAQAPLRVLFGLTEMEASIFHEQVNGMKGSDKLKNTVRAHLSAADSQRLLDSYHLGTEEGSVSHDAMYTLLTDVIFGKPLQDACEVLERLGADVTTYLFRVGNPFPGPFFGKAIHCVDLIYMYDCFYEALQAVEQQDNGRTNAILVDKAQSEIINFITSGKEQVGSKQVLVFDRDKTVELQSPNDLFKRYETLNSCWTDVQSFCADILQLDFSTRRRSFSNRV